MWHDKRQIATSGTELKLQKAGKLEMTKPRITAHIIAAIALNIIAVVFSIGLSLAMSATRSSSIHEALAKEGYSVPLDVIYSRVQAGQVVTGVFVSAPVVISSMILVYCIYKLRLNKGEQ